MAMFTAVRIRNTVHDVAGKLGYEKLKEKQNEVVEQFVKRKGFVCVPPQRAMRSLSALLLDSSRLPKALSTLTTD